MEVCPKQCFSSEGEIKFNSEACNQCGICIENCPVGAVQWSSSKKSSDDILKEVIRDKEYYEVSGGGITLSGGEPLRQYDFCLDIVKKAKMLGLHLAIDTSGFIQTELLENIMNFIDLFLYDIKFIDAELHRHYTGKSNELTLKNFQKLHEANKQVIVRVPLIPSITDKKENLLQIKSFVKTYSKKAKIDYVPFNGLMREKYKMLGKSCNI
jgi:pyruvate formate lyase activating enzyme